MGPPDEVLVQGGSQPGFPGGPVVPFWLAGFEGFRQTLRGCIPATFIQHRVDRVERECVHGLFLS